MNTLAAYGDGLLDVDEDTTDRTAKARDEFSYAVIDELVSSHTLPLRDAVGMLPLEELAGLAETLVSIESLKERVTRGSESVSGPVDVAVISKGDGFIWIKRKHYFKPELNQHYFDRQREFHLR